MLLVRLFILILITFKVNSKTNEILQCFYEPSVKSIDDLINSDKILWKRDIKKYLSPYVVIKQNNNIIKSEYVLVDVRSKKDFKNSHILGAFNLPYTSLTTKNIFKNKKIILIGSGNDYYHLENLYTKLISLGFKNIKILDGGMSYWQTWIEEKTLKEESYTLKNLSKVIAGDFSNWKIINILKNSPVIKKFPSVITISNENVFNNPSSMLSILESKKGLIQNVLLIVKDEDNIPEIVRRWQSKLKANIYVVKSNIMRAEALRFSNNQRLASYKKRADGLNITCL